MLQYDFEREFSAGRSAHALRSTALSLSLLAIVIGSAYISVPLPVGPIPMTMQSLAVLLVSIIGGARVGAGVCATYVALGIMGMPVFAGGTSGLGLAFFAMPTGGFLLSFVIASYAAGRIASSGPNFWIGALLAMTAGHVIIFAGGIAWLSAFLGLEKAIVIGLLPFLTGSLIKIALGTALSVAICLIIRVRQSPTT